jgi:hypothetical protein
MTIASQIATGNRRQVPENGPDVMNSESDSDNDQHGDVIMNGYVGISVNANGDATGSEHHMSNSQAEQMRRGAMDARAQGSQGIGSEERVAGGARVSAGSGQTDTCVTKGHPSKT